MKKQTKKRLFNLLGIGAWSFVLGLSACSSNYQYGDHSEETKQQVYVEKHTRKNITYDDSTYSITYTSSDVLDVDDISYWDNIGSTLYEGGYVNSNPLSIGGNFNVNNTDYTLNGIYSAPNSTSPGHYIISFTAPSFDYNGFQIVYNPSSSHYVYGAMGPGGSYTYGDLVVTSETYYNLFAPSTPSTGDNMPQVLTDFMGLLVGGIQTLAVGIAQGVASMASALFLKIDNGVVTGLSTFGGIIAIFAGIALAVGITTRVYLWITRLGKD